MKRVAKLVIILNGGPGSGHHGHKGIPGQRGGSLPEGASAPVSSGRPVNTLIKMLSGSGATVSESPEDRKRRQEYNYTKTAKLGTLFSVHADELEDKLKKKWFLKANDRMDLANAHAKAAKYLYDSAEQSTMTKADDEEQQLRLEKADWHAKLAREHYGKASGKVRRKEFSRSIGKSFVEGMLGGSLESLAGKAASYLGESASDVAVSAVRSGVKEAIDRSKDLEEAKKLKQYRKDELERAKSLHGSARKALELKAQRIQDQIDELGGFKGFTKKVGSAAGKSASETAKARALDVDERIRDAVKRKSNFERYRDLLKGASEGGELLREKEEEIAAIREMLGLRAKPGTGKYRSRRETAAVHGEVAKLGKELDTVKGLLSALAQSGAIQISPHDQDLADTLQTHSEDTATLESAPSETVTANLAGGVRRETLDGKEYLVAPLSMIVPGVLPGNKGPLYYPPEEVSKNPDAWNNVPIVVNHPMENGRPIAARNPKVLEKYQIGTVFNSRFDGRLVAEGWFDVEKTRKTNIGIYEQLINNKPMELSTGLFTDNEPFEGVHNGRTYKFVARNYRPDHLAILLGSRGACSIRDGCGVLVNKKSDKGESEPVSNIVKKVKDGYKLVSHSGKNLGTAKTKKGIAKREKQVQYFKHVRNESPRWSYNGGKYSLAKRPPKPESKWRKTGKFIGGAGMGAGGTLAGMKAGALAGGGIGSAFGPAGTGIGGLIGGITGAVTGGYYASKGARKLGGKTAGLGADVGGLAGSFAGAGTKLAGRGIAKGASALARGASTAKKVEKAGETAYKLEKAGDNLTKAQKIAQVAKGLSRPAGEAATYAAADAGVQRADKSIFGKRSKQRLKAKILARRKRGLIGNAWTEEARRKALETRKRNAAMKVSKPTAMSKVTSSSLEPVKQGRRSNSQTYGQAIGTGGAIAVGAVATRHLLNNPDLAKKGAKTTKGYLARSFSDPNSPIRHGFTKQKLGWGRKLLNLLKRIKRVR